MVAKAEKAAYMRECNRALGLFQDDPGRLQAAIRYLSSRAALPGHGNTFLGLPEDTER